MRIRRLLLPALALIVAATVTAQDREEIGYPTAPPDVVESRGVTDLMWVASNHPVEELQALLEGKQDIDPLARDFYGNTAMHWVAFYATDPAVINELLEIGVQPNVVNAQGFTAFEIMQGNENLRGSDPYLRLLRAKLDQRENE